MLFGLYSKGAASTDIQLWLSVKIVFLDSKLILQHVIIYFPPDFSTADCAQSLGMTFGILNIPMASNSSWVPADAEGCHNHLVRVFLVWDRLLRPVKWTMLERFLALSVKASVSNCLTLESHLELDVMNLVLREDIHWILPQTLENSSGITVCRKVLLFPHS